MTWQEVGNGSHEVQLD
jgi:hypothetical protein